MYIHKDDVDAMNWEVVNLDTNKRLSLVQWADDEKGVYAHYKSDKDGMIDDDTWNEDLQEYQIFTVKGNIKLKKK